MAYQQKYFELSDDELLVEIAKALNEDSLGALPKPVPILRKEAADYIERNLDKIQLVVCPNKAVQELVLGGFTAELVAAIAAVIGQVTPVSAIWPLAVLLVKRGLSLLCNDQWESDGIKVSS